MKKEIRICGFGGQGIILAGVVLGEAAVRAGHWAVQTQSYGPESRGGAARSEVVIASEPIDYPRVTDADVIVALSQPSYDKYAGNAGGDCLVVVDDMVEAEGARALPFTRTAMEVGHKIVTNIVMLGYLGALLDVVPQEVLEETVLLNVPQGTEELNRKAIQAGRDLFAERGCVSGSEFDPSRIIEIIGGPEQFAQGDVACAYGALLGGCTFFAGYPITPATEVAEAIARLLPRIGGVAIQMEDEIASISAVIGASWTGKRAMTATSGPGFSLMQENLGYACMTEAPCVIVDVQRSGPSTGQPTEPAQGDMLQARWGTHGDHEIIVLAPASVQECVDLTREAFDLAEEYRNPVLVMTDGEVGHMREKIVLEPKPLKARRGPSTGPEGFVPFRAARGGTPEMATFGNGYHTYVTGLTHDERGLPSTDDAEKHTHLVERLCAKISDNVDELTKVERDYEEGASVGIVSYGISSRSAAGAVRLLRQEGMKVSHLRLITVFPFPERVVQEFAESLDRIVVPELNLGQIYHVVREAVAFAAAADSAPPELRGLALADSVAVDPHKWLYAPLEAGCTLVRDPDALLAAFSYRPEYYHFADGVQNFFEHGIQNSRGFRALKVWLVLRHAGHEGYRRMIEQDMELARRFHGIAAEHPELEAFTQSLSITTYRFVPADLAGRTDDHSVSAYLDELNEALLGRMEKSGRAFVSNAVLDGTYALRMCVVNFRTALEDVVALAEITAEIGRAVDGGMRPDSLR